MKLEFGSMERKSPTNTSTCAIEKAGLGYPFTSEITDAKKINACGVNSDSKEAFERIWH